MLAFFAGKSEFPVGIVPHPIPGRGAAGLSARSGPRSKKRRGLQFGPPRTLLLKTEWLPCFRLQHRFGLTSRWSLVFAQPSKCSPSPFGLAWFSRGENNFVCVAILNDQHVHFTHAA